MLALAVRLVGLDGRSLWLDEAFSAWLASRPVAEILAYRDFHPPLYYLILRGWTELGPWFAGDAGLRLPSALASAFGVGLSVWLVQRLRLPGAGLVGALAATSALSVWYAQEARMFALAGLFALSSAIALAVLAARARCEVDGRASSLGWWLAYVLSTSMAVYLGYDAFLVVAVANAAFLWLTWRRVGWVAAWLLANGVAAVLYLPQVGRLMDSLGQARSMELDTRATTLGGAGLAWLGVLAALPAVVWLTPRLPRWARLVPPLAVLAALDLIELTSLGTSVKRHLAVALPLLVLGIGVVLASQGLSRRGRAAVVLVGLPALVAVLFVHPKEDWRAAGAHLTCAVRPNDGIVVYQGYTTVALGRYFASPVPVVGVDGPGSAAGAVTGLRTAERLWLIESHAVDPPSVAPQLADGRRQVADEQFYGVRVRRFDAPGAQPDTDCERSRPAS